MSGMMKFLIFLVVAYMVMAVFWGGDYVRWAGARTGVNLHAVAEVADTFRLDRFMQQRQSEQRAKDRSLLGK
jgi:nitrate reductase gamma subunit